MAAARVAHRDWRQLSGRFPDSRRVLDRPHRLPTGITGSGCRLRLRDAALRRLPLRGQCRDRDRSLTGFPISPGRTRDT